MITAAILFWKASGPVKGFAISLTLGILASLFTALVAGRRRTLVALVKAELTTLNFPKHTVVAGWFATSNQGNKVIVDNDAKTFALDNAASAPVVLRNVKRQSGS